MNKTIVAKTVSPTASRVSTSAASMIAGGSNKVQFQRCKLYFYPSQFAWKRIQRLHQVGQNLRADTRHMSPDQALTAYHAAIEAALGQLLVLADADRLKQFDHLLDAIAATKSFQGLASPFLSCLNTAGLHKDKARVDRATQLWHQYGATAHLGTKLTTAFLVDGTTHTILAISASHLQSMGPGGVKASLMQSANIGHLALQVQGAGLVDVGVAQDGDSCKGAFKLGGGIVGAFVGGVVVGGATLGTTSVGAGVIGFGAGVAVGDIAGDFLCGKGSSGAGGAGGAGGAAEFGGAGSGTADAGSIDNSEQGANQSSEQNQSTDQSQSASQNESSEQNQSSDSSDNSSSGSGDDNHDNGGGMPNPDDPHGFPNPDDPRGTIAFSDTYAADAAADALVTSSASGAWICHGAPQLAAGGTLATAGMLAAVPRIANLMGLQVGSAATAGIAQNVLGAASKMGIAANIGASKVGVATAAAGIANVAQKAQTAERP